jgi:uncharacterized protein (TIGR02147 family)
MPKVFDYLDYRQFLRASYEAGKAANRSMTHRFIERRAGLKSAGHFSQILKGRCNVSPRVSARLAEVFKLKKREAEYFEALVFFNQAGSGEEKKRYFERLLAFRGARHKKIEKDQHAFYSKWYFSAVREILDLEPFRGDYKSLGARLRPPIGVEEAREAMQLLLRLGLVRKQGNGGMAKSDAVVTSGYPVESKFLRAYQLEILDRTREALDRFPKELRNFSTLTVTLSAEEFAVLLEELRAFRGRVLEMAKRCRNPDRIYQCNFQLFPLALPKGFEP